MIQSRAAKISSVCFDVMTRFMEPELSPGNLFLCVGQTWLSPSCIGIAALGNGQLAAVTDDNLIVRKVYKFLIK